MATTAARRPQFGERRIYYNNFGGHLLNGYNPNMLHPGLPCALSDADWRRVIDMIADFGFNVFEFWLEPKLFCRHAMQEDFGRAFVRQVNVVIDHVRARGLKAEMLCILATVGAEWRALCPRDDADWREIQHLWDVWTRAFPGLGIVGIFPGDPGGCSRNGCTALTYTDKALCIAQLVKKNLPSAEIELHTWGPPFFGWGNMEGPEGWKGEFVPAYQGSGWRSDKRRADEGMGHLVERLPEFPDPTSVAVNMGFNPDGNPVGEQPATLRAESHRSPRQGGKAFRFDSARSIASLVCARLRDNGKYRAHFGLRLRSPVDSPANPQPSAPSPAEDSPASTLSSPTEGYQQDARAWVREIARTHPVQSWDFSLTEGEGNIVPHYRFGRLFERRRAERECGSYRGGICFTMTPFLNQLSLRMAAQSFLDPDAQPNAVAGDFYCKLFGPGGRALVPDLPLFEVVQDWGNYNKVDMPRDEYHRRMTALARTLRDLKGSERDDVPFHPSVPAYRAELEFFAELFADLSGPGPDCDALRERYWRRVYGIYDHLPPHVDPRPHAATDHLIQRFRQMR